MILKTSLYFSIVVLTAIECQYGIRAVCFDISCVDLPAYRETFEVDTSELISIFHPPQPTPHKESFKSFQPYCMCSSGRVQCIELCPIFNSSYLPFMFSIILFYVWQKCPDYLPVVISLYICVLSWFQHLLVVDKYPYVYIVWYICQKWLKNKVKESGYFCHSNKKVCTVIRVLWVPMAASWRNLSYHSFFLWPEKALLNQVVSPVMVNFLSSVCVSWRVTMSNMRLCSCGTWHPKRADWQNSHRYCTWFCSLQFCLCSSFKHF